MVCWYTIVNTSTLLPLVHVVKACSQFPVHVLSALLSICMQRILFHSLVKEKGRAQYREEEETFLRNVIRDFPYSENTLIQNIVRTLAGVKVVSTCITIAELQFRWLYETDVDSTGCEKTYMCTVLLNHLRKMPVVFYLGAATLGSVSARLVYQWTAHAPGWGRGLHDVRHSQRRQEMRQV